MSANGYRYNPAAGRHFDGVPNRDLTHEEFRALDATRRRIVRTSPAFTPIPDPPKPKAKPKAPASPAEPPIDAPASASKEGQP